MNLSKKTWPIIVVLILLASFMMYMTVAKILGHNSSVTILTLAEYNVCFIVPVGYEVKKTENGIEYWAKKNIGKFEFVRESIDPTYTPRVMREFQGAYKKIKNFRLAMYDLGEGMIAKESFQFIKKHPGALMMYREDCANFEKFHPPYQMKE